MNSTELASLEEELVKYKNDVQNGVMPAAGNVYIYTNHLHTITLHVNIAGETKLYRWNDHKSAFTQVAE